MSRPARPLALCALASVCLALASPSSLPGWIGVLVLPGLAVLFVACRRERSGLSVWLAGLVYLLWISRSLLHVVGPGIVAIAAVGAVYWSLIRIWTRAFEHLQAPALGFALGVALSEWLRAHMPEIPYPHAQVCHVLAAAPVLLAPLRIGGEALANFLLAWTAARLALRHLPPWKRGVGVVLCLALCLLPWPSARPPQAAPTTLRVLLLQSDYPLPDHERGDRHRGLRALELRTAARLTAADSPPDLVVWPESSLPSPAFGDPPRLDPPLGLMLGPELRLLASTVRSVDRRLWAIAALCDGRGRLLDWQEKQVPVPAGERLPGLSWLPQGPAAALLDWCAGIVGFRPDLEPGAFRPPLRTRSGVAVGALICFDNAFDRVARRQVAAGARLLAVLSNESWYGNGVELDQMLAMTACRAVECGTPLVRSTVDGITCVVSAQGEVLARLPRGAGQGPLDLEMEVTLGPGALPPLAWLHDVVVVLVLCSSGFVVAHRVRSWGSLRPSHPAADRHVQDPGALDSRAPHRRP